MTQFLVEEAAFDALSFVEARGMGAGISGEPVLPTEPVDPYAVARGEAERRLREIVG